MIPHYDCVICNIIIIHPSFRGHFLLLRYPPPTKGCKKGVNCSLDLYQWVPNTFAKSSSHSCIKLPSTLVYVPFNNTYYKKWNSCHIIIKISFCSKLFVNLFIRFSLYSIQSTKSVKLGLLYSLIQMVNVPCNNTCCKIWNDTW